jgi:hypothetical protein
MADDPKQCVIGRIREAPAADERVSELDIDVVADGRIFVTGEVATARRRDVIGAVLAERFPQ